MEAAAPTTRSKGEGAGVGGHQRPWRIAAELPEADLERMAALRSGLRESRVQREQRAEQQRQKQREMAEAWKARREEEAARMKEERKERLQRLQACRAPRANPEDLGDQEYRELMAKHGSKLRSPRVMGLDTAGSSQTTSAGGMLSSRSLEASVPSVPPLPRKPRVPPAPGPRRVVEGLAAQVAEAAVIARPPASATGARRISIAPEGPVGQRRGSAASGSSGLVGALPPMLSPGRGPGGMGVGEHEVASLGLGASGTHPLAPEGDGGQALGPHRSLMPKKDRLRKKQQELMKKTDVVFYRHHMRRHFQRILEAVELTFSDTTRKKKANMNLSNPLTAAELRNLAPAGVRQP